MKRYVTIDFLRGIAIFGMIFVHILVDLYNLGWTKEDSTLTAAPLIAIIMLVAGLYFGAWAGLFLMVSATGNMVSMQASLERGSPIKSIVIKQVMGGFILLFFSFLAEGTLQYYALFSPFMHGDRDYSRMIWKAYTMETIATIAWCMVINGIIQGLLSLNEGYKKPQRNMIIYAVLGIITVLLTQPIWDWARAEYSKFPPTDRGYFRPSQDASFTEYIFKFFLLPLAGQPEPLFPFFAVSCIGSIIGILITTKPISQTWPRKGVVSGILIIITGAVLGIALNLPFDSFLPLNDFSMFTRIGGGLNWRWITWICFITGGQLALFSGLFRLVEYRGKSAKFAEKTKFIRRFGMIPFTLYTFHRTIATLPLAILSWIFQTDLMLESHALNGWLSLFLIGVVILFIHGILILWEKKDYIGGLEWCLGIISASLLGTSKKTSDIPWYRRGARDQSVVFYNVDWADLAENKINPNNPMRNSKLALKSTMMGYLLFPLTIVGLGLARSSQQLEGKNIYNQRARLFGIIGAIINCVLIITLYFLSLNTFGLTSL